MQLLDPSALLEQLPKLLPLSDSATAEASGSSSNPIGSTIRSPHDALALLVHTILTKLSFRLTSLSDDPSNTTTQSFTNNQLPSNWNASGPGSYTFRYAHEQSSLTFLVKVISLGARLLIHATALESNRTESYEVEIDRFTSRNYWPWPSTTNEALVNGFVSSSRLSDFVFGFQVKIIQKLVPGLRKDGYEEISETDQGSSSAPSSSSHPQQQQQPRPARPHYPEHDPDEAYPSPLAPRRDPLIIGDRDLDPLGRGGFGPPPLFGGIPGRLPGGDDGGGMIVGPNHPMFRDRFQQPQGGFGPGGGMVPPGARFDPVNPFSGPGAFGTPGRPGGNGPLGPGGRGPRRPNIGDPDWDEMPPPGNNNGYDDMFM